MTTWASDDLAQIMVAPDNEFAGYAQGLIREWDPETFANVVHLRGANLTNLPVASGVEALTYQPGDVVMLTRWKPGGGRGIAQYWIGSGGRVVFPGAGRAAETVAFMTSELGRQVSAAVFAERIHDASDGGQTTTSSITFGDGSSAGPTLADVEVTEAGRAVLMWGALADAFSTGTPTQLGGYVGLEMSGATSQAPSFQHSLFVGHSINPAPTSHRIQGRPFAARVYTGLNPGLHTWRAKYASQVAGQTVSFQSRTIIAIAF